MEIFIFLLAVVGLILALRNRADVQRLAEKQQQFRRDIERFNNRFDNIFLELRSLRDLINKGPEKAPEPEPAPPPPPAPVVTPIFEASPPVEPEPEPPPSIPSIPSEPPPPVMPPPAPSHVQPARVQPARARFDWEALIGVKLFSWIAGIALVFAAIFFLKYSVEHGWLSPPVRVAIGLIVGAGLLVVCEWKIARPYHVTANALDAAGIAILFSTFFAAHALWNLLGTLPTFALMALVTAVAVLLSIRHDSQFVALLGLLGGFATPILLSTGEDRPIGLFSYLLLLNAGLAWVAYRKRWPYLTTLSVIFTTLYQWGWVGKFLRDGNLPLALGIFLVFPALSLTALVLGEKKASSDSTLFNQTTAVSIALPHVFAIYMAILPGYGHRYWLLFGFLFLVDVGLAAIAAKQGPEILHAASAISTVVVFSIWLQRSYESAAWPWILPITAVFVLFYLSVPYVMSGLRLQFADVGTRAVLAAPILFLVFPVLAAIEPATAAPAALFGALFVLMAIVAVHAVVREEGTVHFVAAFFALAAEAVWSARHLDPSRLLSGLSIYAIFGLFYLGAPVAARRWNKELRPEGAGAIVLFVSLGLLFFLATGSVAPSALWGIALLLTILNLGLFQEASLARRPMVLIAGLLLSWVVIAVWWATVPLASLLIPGLVVAGGFALLILGGIIWTSRRAEASTFGHGLYLALAGHAFLFFVAVQKPLSIPPWPFLAVLAVLDLGIAVASLYSRRGELQLAALAASQVILTSWVLTAQDSPWPTIAILCALTIAGFALAWLHLARRLPVRTESGLRDLLAAASVVASLLGFVVVLAAETATGFPQVLLLAGASVALLCFLLAIDWHMEWRFIAPAAAVPAAVVLFGWQLLPPDRGRWTEDLIFAAVIYAVFLAYPFVLNRRAVNLLQPYLAAVLASVPFFFAARHSLIEGKLESIIGILPVTQAALMAVLLWKLLQLEPAGQRTLGRLALVAGAVLAFITVAIPLQLEKQWITIGWALQAAALAWLCRRIPHKGLMTWTTGLLAAVFVRLVLNPAVFAYHPRSETPILNWYLYTYLTAAAAFFAAAWFLRNSDDVFLENIPRIRTLAAAGGGALLFMLVNIEIADFYSKGPSLTFNFNAGLAQDLTYTIGWGIFAFGLLIGGLFLRSKPARVSAIVLLSITVTKCFLHDLRSLDGLYRIASLVGLAICLTLVALLLQKFVLQPQHETK